MKDDEGGISSLDSKGSPTNILFHFFVVFSKFECALKRSGYLAASPNASVNWDRFTADLGEDIFQELKSSGSITQLLTNPPKKQTVVDGRLSWSPVDAPMNTSTLFAAIRRVRNNLFHGGKYPLRPVDEPSRDTQLLAESLRAISRALEVRPRLGTLYEQAGKY